MEYDEIIEDGEYDDDQITLCFDCGQQAENPGDRLCIFCKNSENNQLERLGVKRKQTEQADGMMAKLARRYAPARVGDNVKVYLHLLMWTKADVNSPMFWQLLCQLLKECSNWQQRMDI